MFVSLCLKVELCFNSQDKTGSVWVKVGGMSEKWFHYEGICEAAYALGVVQSVDIPSMLKFQLARVKVGVRYPDLIPPSTEITTYLFVYDW